MTYESERWRRPAPAAVLARLGSDTMMSGELDWERVPIDTTEIVQFGSFDTDEFEWESPDSRMYWVSAGVRTRDSLERLDLQIVSDQGPVVSQTNNYDIGAFSDFQLPLKPLRPVNDIQAGDKVWLEVRGATADESDWELDSGVRNSYLLIRRD